MPEISFSFRTRITGVILAGGRATRMGGQDKGLIQLNDKCMVEYVIATLRQQVTQLFISANRNQSCYAELSGCPVLTDIFGHYAGPLAGIATGLREAQTDLVLFVPCDSPLLSPQLAKRLYTCLIEANADVSVAENGNRIQPVFALLKRNLLPDLLAFLESGERKISDWYTRQALVRVNCSDIPDTFLNINTPQERNELAARLAATQSFQKRDKPSQDQSTNNS